MHGRNKIDPFDTINMCNQFLLVYLIKKVESFQSRGLSKNSMVYRNAIHSIKRYPMPIICRAQLESINGIGQYLSQQLEKVIKQHYSAYLDFKQKNNIKQVAIQKQDDLSRNIENSERFQQLYDYSQQISKNATQSGTHYKPRINTANAYFLVVLRNMISENHETQSKRVSKQKIQKQVQYKYPAAKNKAWNNIEEVLLTNGYIAVQKSQQINKKDEVYYKTTQKGLNYANTIDEKTKNNNTKNKILNQVKLFKQTITSKTKQQKPKQSKQNLNSFCIIDDPQEEQIRKKLSLKHLNLNQNQVNIQKLVLIIDNRQKKDKTEQVNFFYQKILQKYKINCINANLNLGDFLWVYDGKVLDYIIQRKKADDLAASILDGRYKDQKYRLKKCGISNVYYIYQGHPSDRCCLSEKQLKNALLKTRFRENFKVYKTKDVGQTMDLLNAFHKKIFQAILLKKAKYLCQIDEFNEYNSVQRSMTVGNVFALGLMCIPGLGKSGVRTVTQYFKTYRQTYDVLRKLEGNDERIEFLKLLFKGSGLTSSFPETMVAILFAQNYKQQNQKKMEEKKEKQNKPQKLQKDNLLHQQNLKRQRSVHSLETNFQETQTNLRTKRFSVIHEQDYQYQSQIYQKQDNFQDPQSYKEKIGYDI